MVDTFPRMLMEALLVGRNLSSIFFNWVQNAFRKFSEKEALTCVQIGLPDSMPFLLDFESVGPHVPLAWPVHNIYHPSLRLSPFAAE